ncbi:hypothetical protein [Leptospira kemamanensis]|uniref:hypothetical protein n=1 Tax=Leptospira kemamanensis TaxID=2484942 RepID=UPI00142E7012|nr:hypothetical protein [Leptospira kemamanensis]
MKGGEIILSQEILKTEPDEIVYASKFKNIILDEDSLAVLDKFETTIYEIKLDQLNL